MILASSAMATNTLVSLNTNHGPIIVKLYDDTAPITVANFLSYVNSGFYDGLVFHRTIKDFMIQTGAYDSGIYNNDPDSYHAPNDPIPLETTGNHKNLRGTISMARTDEPDSAASGFFINVIHNTHLDPSDTFDGHAVFGEVISDMFPVDAISCIQTFVNNSVPVMPVVIESATVVQCVTKQPADLNGDCYVNLLDLAVLANNWLNCTDFYNDQCTQ
jgi:peptidyl-prolyl cis-trans isomerase A (cyclophilin A)